MLLEFTAQAKGIAHQDAPQRRQLREELHCREIRGGAVWCFENTKNQHHTTINDNGIFSIFAETIVNITRTVNGKNSTYYHQRRLPKHE